MLVRRAQSRIRDLQAFAPGRKFPTPKQLAPECHHVIETLLKAGRPLTFSNIALGLGVSLSQYRRYESGEFGDFYVEVLDVVRTIVLSQKNEGLLTGELTPAGAIFDLKNNHGWTDGAQEFNVNTRLRVSAEPLTPEEWEERYASAKAIEST